MTARTDRILALIATGLQDGQIAETMAAETMTIDGDSPILAISNMLWASGDSAHRAAAPGGGPWGRIIDDAAHYDDPANPEASVKRRTFLLDCVYIFEAKGADTIGWGDDPMYPIAIEAMLDGLIQYGYIDAAIKSAIMAQRYQTVPKWEMISHLEVATVRRGEMT